MNKFKFSILAGLIVIGLIGGFVLTSFNQNLGNSATSNLVANEDPELINGLKSNQTGTILSFTAVAGKTVLETLTELAVVETQKSVYGDYVTGINGVSSSAEKFWLFYVNGQPATVGAGEYIAQAGDIIEWRLE